MKRFRAAAITAAALISCITLGALGVPGVRAQVRTYLPDSTVIARVDDRLIRVYDFRDRYFASDHESRPSSDSLGRVAFLGTMIDKEVMGLTAIALNRPLDPADMRTLRQHEESMLTFLAYRQRVKDPVVITEDQLRALYAEQAWELRLRYLLLPDEVTATWLRNRLVRGQITWREAATRYSLGPDSLREGDLGWRSRSGLEGAPRVQLFKLRPPGFSEVTLDGDGYKIWQCLGRRPAALPAFYSIHHALEMELRANREAELDRQFMAELSARVKLAYDTTAIVWLADRFREANEGIGGPGAAGIDLRSRVPVLSNADTSRVLATVEGRKVTCGFLTTAYRDMSPLRRPRIQTPASLFQLLQRMVLEPVLARYAREKGLDHDPEFTAEISKKREGMRVQHLYEDSIQTHIRVTEAMRREFYDANANRMITRERVRYALIPRLTEAGADSVMARLQKGETPQAILAQDSLGGMTRGSIREVLEGQPHAYRALLFEELRAGQSGKQFLDQDHIWVVFHVLSHDMPKDIPYVDARDMVDQSVEGLVAEQLLRDFLARQRTGHHIESHPELLQRIRLTDPAGD